MIKSYNYLQMAAYVEYWMRLLEESFIA